MAEASRQLDLAPSEVEGWVEDGKRGMENALRAKPEDVRDQYQRQLKDLQEAYGEAMLELHAQKKISVPGGQGREWTRNGSSRAPRQRILIRAPSCHSSPDGTGRHQIPAGPATPGIVGRADPGTRRPCRPSPK